MTITITDEQEYLVYTLQFLTCIPKDVINNQAPVYFNNDGEWDTDKNSDIPDLTHVLVTTDEGYDIRPRTLD